MKLHSIFSAIVIVAAAPVCADVLNVEVLDLDAPREEPPTVVPTRPPDDPEPVFEDVRPSLPGTEDDTNRVAVALLEWTLGTAVDHPRSPILCGLFRQVVGFGIILANLTHDGYCASGNSQRIKHG